MRTKTFYDGNGVLKHFWNCIHCFKLRLLTLPYAIKMWLIVQHRRDEFFTFPVSRDELVAISFRDPVKSMTSDKEHAEKSVNI